MFARNHKKANKKYIWRSKIKSTIFLMLFIIGCIALLIVYSNAQIS